MRRFGKWSVGLGVLAFTALPLLASGCAENQTSAPESGAASSDAGGAESSDTGGMEDLPADDLGEPEGGSQR